MSPKDIIKRFENRQRKNKVENILKTRFITVSPKT